jgi:hypothetical protein
MKKAQVEFVAIIGIIVVAIVVIYTAFFASQPISPGAQKPQAIQQKENLIRNSAQDFFRQGAISVIATMSRNGGFPEEGDLWFKDGKANVPDLEQNFARAFEGYLTAQKASLANTLREPVTILEPTVEYVELTSGQVRILLNQPMQYQQHLLIPDYEIRVQTDLGKIYGFAKLMAEKQAEERFLEHLTLYHMQVAELPFTVFLTECAETYEKEWSDLAPNMTAAMGSLKTSTTMQSFKFEGMQAYSDLEASLSVGLVVDREHFSFTPDPILVESPLEFAAVCFTEPMDVNYTVRYPVNMEIKDRLTGNIFKLGMEVFIKDSIPGVV